MIVSFNPFEFHHLYFGIILIILSIIFRKHKRLHYILLIVGTYLTADDMCQHTGGVHALFVWLWSLTGLAWPFGGL